MTRSIIGAGLASPRRFVLLREEAGPASTRGVRIRRYQLASLGHGGVGGHHRRGGAGLPSPTSAAPDAGGSS